MVIASMDAQTPRRKAAAVVHGLRRCRDCGREVGKGVLYCATDRTRRRAITFLLQAKPLTEELARPIARRGARAAHEAVLTALEELGG